MEDEPVKKARLSMLAQMGVATSTTLAPRPQGYVHTTMLTTSSLAAMSGQKRSEKFSFSKASRFPAPKQLQKSKSSPAYSMQASTAASEHDGIVEQSQDLTSAGPSAMLTPAGPSVEFARVDSDEEEPLEDGSTLIVQHPVPAHYSLSTSCGHGTGVARIDGSMDRLGEFRQRSAHPLAKSYDPTLTLGGGTHATYNRFPHYSFGGGPSRVPDVNGNKEHLASLPNTSPKTKGRGKPNPVTLMDLKDACMPKTKRHAPLARGFGSATRLNTNYATSAPGPGAYDVARDSDPAPEWFLSSHGPITSWSKFKSDRPDAKNRTGNPPNIGPGDAIADHPFKPSGPSPIFGHPLNDFAKPDWPGLEPTRYSLPSTLSRDRSPNYSVGVSKRPAPSRGTISQGPAHYDPQDEICYASSPPITFSRSERQHQSDLIDPDEPPGPGAHTVRREPKVSDKPSAGMPRDMKLKKMSGMGPDGPGPGHYASQSTLDKRASGMATRIPRPVLDAPGPHDTAGGEPHNTDLLTYSASPSWGSLVNRSSVRKPPWKQLLQPPEFKLKSGEKLIMSSATELEFRPGGPKFSIMPRRREVKWDDKGGMQSGCEHMVVTTSMG